VLKQWLLHKSGLITKILSYLMGLLLTLAGMGEGMSVSIIKFSLHIPAFFAIVFSLMNWEL
jgi:hypothetical protein